MVNKELIAGGAFSGRPLTICRQRVDGEKPLPLDGAPYMDFVAVSPDGSRIAGLTRGDGITIFDIASKRVRHIGSSVGAFPVAWSRNGEDLYALTHCDLAYRIWKIGIETGKREEWKTITPPDVEDFSALAGIVATPSTGAYAYSSNFNSSHLYVVDGWS